jgi:hypothetical protein
MQKKMAELLEYLDATRQRLVETVADINPTFAAMKPHDNVWSVEQNMSHLAIVEAGVARLVAKSVDWAKANGIGPETSDESMMASLDEFGIADARFRRESPSGVAPDERPIADSLSSLAASRVRLKEALLVGQGLDLTLVKRPHPAMGDIDLYQWALFVAQHEERHRRQIENTLGEATELAAECAPIV